MTPKQMYSALAKIAGAVGESGQPFARSAIVSAADLKRAQAGLLALLDKLNYRRCAEDFGGAVRMSFSGLGQVRPGYIEALYREAEQMRQQARYEQQAQYAPGFITLGGSAFGVEASPPGDAPPIPPTWTNEEEGGF